MSATKPRFGHFLGSNDDVLWEKNTPSEERLRTNAQIDLGANPLLFMMPQPWMGSIRKFTRALALDMDVAAAEGRPEQVLDDLEAICLLANLVSDPPLIVTQLLGDAMRMLAAERFGRELAQYPGLFSVAQLDRAAAILTRASAHGQIDLEWEKRATQDLAQRVFSDDGYGDGLMTIEGWNLLTELAGKQKWGREMIILVGPLVAKAWGTRSQFDQFLNRVFQDSSTEANKAPWERTRSWLNKFESEVNSNDAPRSSFIVFASVPAIPKAFAARSSAQMELRAVVAAIAAERFRLEHSRFPRNDMEMSSAMGKAPPVDVFDGNAIRFRFSEDELTIYSVGADRVDNGGERAMDADAPRKWVHSEELLSLSKAQRDAMNGDWILWPPNEVTWADGSKHPLRVRVTK
ncbi:MAG: hypothetical protein JNK16_07140 [Phycisphaerales bacterium]|nr:hypothetical protein [Phycisphaerales bacterium]